MSLIEEVAWDRSITFFVNGKMKTLHNGQVDPRTTLLCYLRDTIGLTGTKLGCGEGGCGACTVMISYFDKAQQKIRHKSANACLTPVCAIDGMAITTVEGIGGMKKGLHPVQQRISSMHGSQCGFCTPGIVMALYAYLREYPNATPNEIEEAMDGNLCRCTGYRPILDAAKSLSNNKPAGGCCGGSGGGCPCKQAAGATEVEKRTCCQSKSDAKSCCQDQVSTDEKWGTVTVKTKCSEGTINSLPGLDALLMEQGITEPIFPPSLLKYVPKSVMLTYTPETTDEGSQTPTSTFTWYYPATLPILHSLKAKHNNAKLIVGNTEVGIETRFKLLEYDVFVNPSNVPELNVLRLERDAVDKRPFGLRVGGNTTINGLREYIEQLEVAIGRGEPTDADGMLPPAYSIRGLVAIKTMLTWFASNQIRNVACVAGNICTASPISDLNPMLLACKAIATVSSASGKRDVPMSEFFLGYRKVNLHPSEVLESVMIPFTNMFEYVVPCKQARRREDDISIVTAGMRFELEPVNIVSEGSVDGNRGFWTVKDCTLAYGGMSPITKCATKTQECLINKQWCNASIEGVFNTLKCELFLPEQVPGGQAEYRMSLAASFLFRAYLKITQQVENWLSNNDGLNLPRLPEIDAREQSAGDSFVTLEKPPTTASQKFIHTTKGDIQVGTQTEQVKLHDNASQEFQQRTPVGDSVMHKSAALQVTGEALYTDDIPTPTGCLYAALVTSTKGHAKLISVDPKPAEACPGFVAFYCAKDVTGDNNIGAILKDEEVFATDEVKFHGAVIGMVVAESHEEAMYAARKVAIEYEELPCVVTIEEAIEAQSFYPTVHTIDSGDVEKMISSGVSPKDLKNVATTVNMDSTDTASETDLTDIVMVEGDGKIGSQEHFYLETNCTLVLPKESGHLEIFASTQNQSKTQMLCASVCGLPAHQVVCRVKRMGGGFGGKETKSVFISVTAALAAYKLGKPVKINIERDLDMATTGQRHAFYYKYKAGCHKRTGKLCFMDAEVYNNAGFSWDLSQPVMDRALFHCDNAYYWPNMRVKGIVCKTNQCSHTAFRGFGGPQGMFLADIVMQHLSEAIQMPLLLFKEINLYKNGDRTHYGQLIEDYYLPDMLVQLKKYAEVERREKDVQLFNANNKWKKRGINVNMTKFGINFTAKFYNQGGALVMIYTDGSVLVSHGGTEMGQGLHTKMVQVAAQAFGIPHTMVHVEETSTNCVPNASPTAASMSTDLYGMAVLNACEQIRNRLLPIREKMGSDASWKDVVTAAYFDRICLSATGFYAVPSERCGYDWDIDTNNNSERGTPFNYYTQGVACTEVEIDVLSGDSHIVRADILMDVGKSINPSIDIGQIEGAYVQGYGYCSMEEMVWGDRQHKWIRPGQLFTRGPGTYKIPAFNDIPKDMRVHLADTNNRFAVHSSKAVGEPPYYLGVSSYFAIRQAILAARKEFTTGQSEELDVLDNYLNLHCPATSERIRTSCQDPIVMHCVDHDKQYHAKGSW